MKNNKFNLNYLGITNPKIFRNLPIPELYEKSIRLEKNSVICENGALIVSSGDKTGRSPKNRKIIRDNKSERNIDWGDVNIPADKSEFNNLKKECIKFLDSQDEVYVFDGFAGWDKKHRIKVRVICTRPYHAIFMNNMLIRSSIEELEKFGEPDYTIINAGQLPNTSILLNIESGEILISGTEYAGEMKKAIFSVMNYIMPLKGVLPMHCSANIGNKNDVSIFFGLSGTGKTSLSADPKRKLIGDDEHCWTDDGIFNIEGGCYAKTINLDEKNEPEIFHAIKFGTILENVVYDDKTRKVNFDDKSITENTRASYPIEFIDNSIIPCVATHPKNIIFLTCDAYGVLPPISKLTPEQAAFHFISGYTSKVAGTEVGVMEPTATFSACFGAAFMLWHPNKYAELLSNKIKQNETDVWLLNTGWVGGQYGVGKRIDIKYSRTIIDVIHDGAFKDEDMIDEPIFGVKIPKKCPNIPDEILNPRNSWEDKKLFDLTINKVATMFNDNFNKFEDNVNNKIISAKPKTKY